MQEHEGPILDVQDVPTYGHDSRGVLYMRHSDGHITRLGKENLTRREKKALKRGRMDGRREAQVR
jgi:hypothetical protein